MTAKCLISGNVEFTAPLTASPWPLISGKGAKGEAGLSAAR